MARKARAELQTNVFLVTQSSKQRLFTSDKDREALISMIKQSQETFGFLVYAYCLLSDYEFKLVINTQKQSISKIMQSIGVAYAYYRNTKEKLFPRRFKSKALYSIEEVQNAINNIEVTGKSTYNSYCMVNDQIPSSMNWLTKIDHQPIVFHPSIEQASDDELRLILNDFLAKHNCNLDTILHDKALRNQCILRLRQETNCSLKQIGFLLGELSESTVSKILKNQGQHT